MNKSQYNNYKFIKEYDYKDNNNENVLNIVLIILIVVITLIIANNNINNSKIEINANKYNHISKSSGNSNNYIK